MTEYILLTWVSVQSLTAWLIATVWRYLRWVVSQEHVEKYYQASLYEETIDYSLD